MLEPCVTGVTAVEACVVHSSAVQKNASKLHFILSPGPQIHLYHNVKNPTKLTPRNAQEQERRRNKNIFSHQEIQTCKLPQSETTALCSMFCKSPAANPAKLAIHVSTPRLPASVIYFCLFLLSGM